MFRKLKDWICNGNDCSKCKQCWEARTSYEYDEWDCGCYIKGDDFDMKACHLIEPFKSIIGFLQKRKADYYMAHEWDGFVDFMDDLEDKDNKMYELFMNKVLGENYVICWKSSDGSLNECNTESFVKNHIWEVRSEYEDFAHPVVHKKLSTEWKKLIKKTMQTFYNRTIGRIVPYIVG